MASIKAIKEKPEYDKYAYSKVTTMGNVIEVVTMQKRSFGSPCRKIDKDHYCDQRTGEVSEYTHIENRSQSLESIRHTLARIRALLNTNATVPKNCKWLTFTYAENMTDAERLYQDFRKFWQKFKRWCRRNGIAIPEYITVQEPQGRGAWHVHAFFIWQKKAPFIPNEVIANMWDNGWTKTKAVNNCDNVGAYFSAYLADMPLEDVERLTDEEKQKVMANSQIVEKTFTDEKELIKQKKFIKGARLYLYPPGMNIVRTTKGIKTPEVEQIYFEEVKEKVSAATETFSSSFEIVNDSGEVVNVVSKSYYNTRR